MARQYDETNSYILPELQTQSISRFLPNQYFQRYIPLVQNVPDVSGLVNQLGQEFAKSDKEISDYETVLNSTVSRLPFDEDVVKEELAKYQIDPELVNDPYAHLKVKRLGAKFKGALTDTNNPLHIAMMAKAKEDQMMTTINKMIVEGKLDEYSGRQIMEENKRRYRSLGGARTGTQYQDFETPATLVNDVEKVRKMVEKWAMDETGGTEKVYAYPDGNGYILKGSDGRIIKRIGYAEVHDAIRPLLMNDPEIKAYYEQLGRVETYGLTEAEIKQKLLSEYPSQSGIINSTSDIEGLRELSSRLKHETRVNDLTKLGAESTSFESNINSSTRDIQVDSLYLAKMRTSDDKVKEFRFAIGQSGSQASEGLTYGKMSDMKKKLSESSVALKDYLNKSLNSPGTLEALSQKAMSGELTREEVTRAFNGNPDMIQTFNSYVENLRTNQAITAKQRFYEQSSKFDWSKAEQDGMPWWNKDAVISIVSQEGYRKAMQDAIRQGISYSEFIKNNPQFKHDNSPNTQISGGVVGTSMILLGDNDVEDLYSSMQSDYQTGLDRFMKKSTERSYAMIEGIGDKNNYFVGLGGALTDMVTRGGKLQSENTFTAGNYQMLLAEHEGLLEGGVYKDGKAPEYTDIKVTLGSTLGSGDKPVYILSAKNKDGKRISIPVTAPNAETMTQTREMVEQGLNTMVTSNIDSSNYKAQSEHLLRMYAGTVMNGQLESSGLYEMAEGSEVFVRDPRNTGPMLKVKKGKSGYQVWYVTSNGLVPAVDGGKSSALVPNPNTTGFYSNVDEILIKIGRDFYGQKLITGG